MAVLPRDGLSPGIKVREAAGLPVGIGIAMHGALVVRMTGSAPVAAAEPGFHLFHGGGMATDADVLAGRHAERNGTRSVRQAVTGLTPYQHDAVLAFEPLLRYARRGFAMTSITVARMASGATRWIPSHRMSGKAHAI